MIIDMIKIEMSENIYCYHNGRLHLKQVFTDSISGVDNFGLLRGVLDGCINFLA